MQVQTQPVDVPDNHPLSPNYHTFHQELGRTNPDHPWVTSYLRSEGKLPYQQGKVPESTAQEMQDEMQQELSQTEQDDEAWAREMLELAGDDEEESEPKFKDNDEVCRAFADDKI